MIESALAEGRKPEQLWLEQLQHLSAPMNELEGDHYLLRLQELVQLAASQDLAQETGSIVDALLMHWPHHLSTARCLNCLAALYHESGLYFKAEQVSRQALSINEDLSVPNALETATSLNGVGEALL